MMTEATDTVAKPPTNILGRIFSVKYASSSGFCAIVWQTSVVKIKSAGKPNSAVKEQAKAISRLIPKGLAKINEAMNIPKIPNRIKTTICKMIFPIICGVVKLSCEKM